MTHKFNGDVGQVAGRDVKSTSAQANVNVHFHGAELKPVAMRYISDKQRNAIARKAFEIEAKTGTDKLMVYRRLMSVFDFERMDEMPRNVYERAIKYLDSWIRNGTLAQAPRAPAQQDAKAPATTAATPERVVSGAAPDECVAPLPEPPVAPAPTAQPAPTRVAEPPITPSSASVQPTTKRTVWIVGALVVTAVMVVAVVRNAAPDRSVAPATSYASESPRCEYGGSRYSLGGVVVQAGIRKECIADGEGGVRWERVSGTRH
jgi:hypothetical protein